MPTRESGTRLWRSCAANRLKSNEAEILKQLAWNLALPADRPPREYDEAVQYARQEATLAPKANEVHFVLALAEYRCGRSAEAVAAAERSMALRQGGDAMDWFLLAMALAQKGDKVKAAPWFDKAVAWTKEKERRTCTSGSSGPRRPSFWAGPAPMAALRP